MSTNMPDEVERLVDALPAEKKLEMVSMMMGYGYAPEEATERARAMARQVISDELAGVIRIWRRVICKRCGAWYEVVVTCPAKPHREEFVVEPCGQCMEVARNEGRERAWDSAEADIGIR